MNKPYIYISEDAKAVAEPIAQRMQRIKSYNSALFIIGDNADVDDLKRELNFVNDKKYTLHCIFLGDKRLDSGLRMQLGLAKLYGSDELDRLEKDLSQCRKKPDKKKIIAVIAAVLIIASVGIAVFTKDKPAADPIIETADNLTLDDVYLKAFTEQGLDCIVVDGGISREEMLTAEKLDLSGLGIENLEPLLYAANLVELDLSNNNISDITALTALSKLEILNIENNPVKDYSILDYLPSLKEVRK